MCGTPRAARQSRSRRRRTMLRLSVLLILLTQRARTAHVTEQPTFANRLEKLYEKIEKLTAAPIERDEGRSAASPREKLLAKLDTLSSLGNSKLDLSVGGEESLYGMLTEQQVRSIFRDLQRLEVADDERNSDGEYGDGDWNDDDDYPMDEEWDGEEPESNSLKAPLLGSRLGAASGTPSAITKLDRRPASVAAQQLALTNERPAVLDDSNLSPSHKMTLKRAAMDNLLSVVHAKKCLTPQPRWYSVRQLAPAADTVYTPSCVQLHRCAPDSGCCYTEGEVCAPVEGKHVAKAFYLHKANGEVTVSRVVFYNHTRCACVNSDALNDAPKVEPSPDTVPVQSFEIETTVRQHRVTTSAEWQPSTEEPKLERDAEASESTEPPQLIRRCTCPALFKARPNESGCHCVCDWPSVSRRRDCQLLAKGKEHFGLKDRVCVDNGDCHPPACEYGPYNRDAGQCPVRKYKRPRLHARGRYND